ncbi:chromosome partition protein Smc [Anopheles cruzii]|uniref:chromosome partition protein Smc n=1 Tax=Anopheles cruzii TaxID=68878 RepID=UPI0022EC8005|nr:chromosome partition protein Smc [Anopheles cruzii]
MDMEKNQSSDMATQLTMNCSCFQTVVEVKAQLAKLERINETLQNKLDNHAKDNENLVIKYAFVEKKVIDLRSLVEEKESKLLKNDHEIAALQKQIGVIRAEKLKLQQSVDSKLAITEETKNNAEHAAEMDKKYMEFQAREIMLKHAYDEQAAKMASLQKINGDLRESLVSQEKKYASCMKTLTDSENGKQELRQHTKQLQEELELHSLKIEELATKLNDASVAALESSRMEATIKMQQNELEQLHTLLEEQTSDAEAMKANELELLALNRDLSELNCLLQKEITNRKCNTLAVTLEYEKFVKMCYDYDAQIASLANSLAVERQERTEERLLMAKHIADKTRKLNHTEQCLQQTINDLEAHRKKHEAIVKDFKREMKNVQYVCVKNTVADGEKS